MRILLINQYAGSPSTGMEYRPHWMAAEWMRQGHEVLVVAGDQSHLRHKPLAPGTQRIDGVPYQILPTVVYQSNGIRRFANIMSFRMELSRQSRELQALRPHVVVASSTHPMDARPALKIAKSIDALFVFEVHDLWPLTPQLIGGLPSYHPMVRLMRREEAYAYRSADLAVSLLPRTRAYMEGRGLRQDRWVHIPNGYSPQLAPSVPGRDNVALVAEVRRSWPFVFVFAGSLNPANNLGPFLALGPELEQLGAAVVVYGDGPDRPALEGRFGSQPNIRFAGRIPRTELECLLPLFDAGYVGLRDSPLYDHGVSLNKVYDYMGAGLPILEYISRRNGCVDEIGCGSVASPEAPESLYRAAKEMVNASEQTRREWALAGLRHVKDEMNYQTLASRALAEFESRLSATTHV